MSKAWYALRRTLPHWNIDENLPELVRFCKQNFVDEVILKVDSEEFTHAIPSLEWLQGYLPHLKRAKSELNAAGVVFSINPWTTLVHCDRGRRLKDTYPDIDLMVGHDGTKCTACACPLSEGWRKATRDLWRLYASTEPDVLWVEDDIRLINHQPIVYGCFCDLHIQEFSKRVGKSVSREELVSALLQPGTPHPYRKIWLDLNRDVMNEVARFFERCVHEVSPKTKLGLMCSPPMAHAIEGRDWAAFTSALAGDQPLVVRPCLCCYNEGSPRDLYDSEYHFKTITDCVPSDVILQTEVENWPFTGYSKSVKFTNLQCALSFIFGANGVTLNLFDHMGNPLSVAPEFGEMLRVKKPFYESLAQACYGGKQRGVGLIHAQDGSYNVQLREGAHFMWLAPEGHGWRIPLEALGFPVTFEESDVIALTGQVVRSLSDERIKQILSSAALIDLQAMNCLIDRGYGEYLGVSVKRIFRKFDEPLAAEEYFNPDFGGCRHKYLSHTLPHLGGDAEMADTELADGTVLVSHVVDPDNVPRYPFVTLYENSLGGRVAIYPVDIQYMATGPSFLHPYRKEQLEAVMNWLTRGGTPLVVSGGVYPLPFRLDFEDRVIVGAMNLALDDWPSVTFDLEGEHKGQVKMLGEDGTWHDEPSAVVSSTPAGTRIELHKPLASIGLVVLCIKQ